MLLYGTPAAPVPEGAMLHEIITEDGVHLRAARWSARGEARGTVALLHGRCEFIEKHFEVVEELRARGFAVATFDWRGQGGSQRLLPPRLKGHVESFTHYQRDLAAFVQNVLPLCPPPYYALTHSMGGLVLLQSLMRGPSPFARIVLETPLLGLSVVPFQKLTRPLIGLLARHGLAHALPPGATARPVTEIPFSRNFSTTDPERYARIAEMVRMYPDLALGPPTLGWVDAAFTAMTDMARVENMARIHTPMRLIAGGNDRLVSNAAISRFATHCPTADLVVIPGARHEIFTERDDLRARFWSAFDEFIPGPQTG